MACLRRNGSFGGRLRPSGRRDRALCRAAGWVDPRRSAPFRDGPQSFWICARRARHRLRRPSHKNRGQSAPSRELRRDRHLRPGRSDVALPAGSRQGREQQRAPLFLERFLDRLVRADAGRESPKRVGAAHPHRPGHVADISTPDAKPPEGVSRGALASLRAHPR